jgi:DNA-binding response OmpR family regulator
VESDERMRTLIRGVLQNERFAVIDFPDPESALDALPAFRDELSAAVADFSFSRQLASGLPHVPILMLSSAQQHEQRTLIQGLRGLIGAARQMVPIAVPSMS